MTGRSFFFLLLETAVVAIRQARTKKLFAQVVKKIGRALLASYKSKKNRLFSKRIESLCSLCSCVYIFYKQFEEINKLKIKSECY
jgi:hypothetical protein